MSKTYSWDDLSEAEYRRQKAETEAALAKLPTNNKLVLFDQHREVLLTMPENIVHATREQLQALLARLVERVETHDRRGARVVWTPPARPFFAAAEAVADGTSALLWCPQGDSNP